MIGAIRMGVEEENVQERIQRYGGYLAAMVLPNIGAILAWGLITAFVIDTGWCRTSSSRRSSGR